MSAILSRAQELIRTRGIGRTLSHGAAYAYRERVRPLLPATRRMSYAGIPTAVEAKVGDRWLPDSWVPGDLRDIPGYEETLLGEVRRLARTGDRIVVVGGGVGVTATVAAQHVGPSGRVHVFEGGARGVRDVGRTAALNGVAGRVTVQHAVVARGLHVYGRREAAVVAPDALPECDVLELDCEGAEVDILREMTIRPRAVVVETHGVYGAPTETVVGLLEAIGYDATVADVAEPRIREICEDGDIRVVGAERRA